MYGTAFEWFIEKGMHNELENDTYHCRMQLYLSGNCTGTHDGALAGRNRKACQTSVTRRTNRTPQFPLSLLELNITGRTICLP